MQGSEMVDTRLHEALEAEDFAEAIRSTLRAGARLAAFDEAGRTALHLCVHRRALGPFKVLLSYEGSVNLGDADGCPVLNVAILHNWVDGARAALAAGADVTAVTTIIDPDRITIKNPWTLDDFQLRYPSVNPMFLELVFEQTPVHLAVRMNILGLLEEILEGRNEIVDCLNAYGNTPLFAAVWDNNMPAVKTLLMRGASVSKAHNLLNTAARHPFILNHILNRTDAVDSLDHNGFVALIHKAVIINCPESVHFLLKRSNYAKVKSGGVTALHVAAYHASNQAAQVILEHDPSSVHELDDDCYTPLAIAAESGNKALISMLLKKGAVLSTKSNKKTTIIELIASRLLDCSNFFELVFDEFIYTDEFNNINVDYGFLTDTDGTSQINVIEEFVRCGQSKILLHPLIESLLYLKWRHLLPVFCLIIGVYCVFIITFNIFVAQTFYYRDIDGRNFTDYSHKRESRTQGLFEMYGECYWLLISLIYSSLSAMLGLELFYIYLKRLRYFRHLESWVKMCVLTLGATVPCAVTAAEPADWLRHAACAALLLGWLQAMFLLARFPYWGNFVLMFGKVAINLLKVLVTALFLIIAFSFCFMIEFRSQSPFDGPFPAFVKTLVMMSSEFEYEDLFGPKHDNELQETRTVARLLFMLFVIFLAIVLMNFMIGAAVSDIEDLKVTGNIKRLIKQVELLSILDSLVEGGFLDKIFKKTFSDEKYYKKIRIMCGIQVQWNVECATTRLMLLHDSEALLQFHSNTYLLPLHKAFIDIATKQKKIQERKCSKTGVEAKGAQKDEVKRNDSCCSDQIKVDRDLLQPQPNIQTNCTYLHDLSLKIEQLTSDMASIKQMTSHMAAGMKELSSEIAKKKAEPLAFH